MAQVRRLPRIWSPVLEVDGAPIAMDATLRHFRGGHAGLMAEALQQPLLLPQDMAAYGSFNHPDLFRSLKRDLAMVSNSVHFSFIFVAFFFLNLSHLITVHNKSRNKFTWRGVGEEFS